jgi:type IV pilus assembly protein PilE
MSPNKGFSLIEVMIAVAIVAILVAVALPSYQRYVIRTGRTEARTLMVEVAALQERFRYNNPGYATSLGDLGLTTPLETENRRYVVTMNPATATAFTLVATRQNSQASDAECGNLTLTNAGVRGESGTGTAAECWR